MRSVRCLLLCCALGLACSTQPEKEQGPSPPVLLAPPDDLALVERGIDAVPEADAIQIDWLLPEQVADLAGFRLYRRTARGAFVLLKSLKSQDTTFVDDQNIEVGTRYYYFMTSVDRAGREGPPSDTVDYALVPKAFNLHSTGTLTPVFRWQVHDYPSQYVVKLFDLTDGSKVWFSLVFSDFADQDEEVTYNWDGTAATPTLIAGRSYRWRVDVVGSERNSGSESNWRRFTVAP